MDKKGKDSSKDILSTPQLIDTFKRKIFKHLQIGLRIWEFTSPYELETIILIYSNAIADRITKSKSSKLLNKPIKTAIPEILKTNFPSILKETLHSGKSVIIDEAFSINNKNFIVIQTIPLDKTHVATLYQDTTEITNCKKSLSESQSCYQCLFENWLTGIFISDIDGKILACNQTFCDMFGFQAIQLINKPVEKLFHPEYRDQLVKYKKQIDEKNKVSIETILTRKDGTPLTVEIFGAKFLYHGKPAILNVVRNIIERKQIEFAHLSRLSTLDEMVTNLAHELNQPLGAISNYAQGCIRRLQNGNGNHNELINAIQQIIKQSERAANIIQRIRHFVSNGKLKFIKFNLNEMIKESISFLETEAKQAEAKIETHCSKKTS